MRRLAQNRVYGEHNFVPPAIAPRDSLSLEDAAELLGRMRREIQDHVPLLVAISDDVMSQLAKESIDRAKAIEVSVSTAERRNRGKGRQVFRPEKGRDQFMTPDVFARGKVKRTKYGKRKKRRKSSTLSRDYLKVPWKTDARGMAEALTTSFEAVNNPAALRVIRGDTLYWGTQKYLTWTSYHMQLTTPEGKTKWMPARIDFMAKGERAAEVSQHIVETTQGWIALMMSRAGAPDDWLMEQLPEGF